MASLREWTEILRDLLRLPARRQFERDLFKMLRSEVPVILLVGPTGSGKSSFVKSLTDKAVLVSPEESCTKNCEVYAVKLDLDGTSKIFILIDTPGLHGRASAEKDLKILENIALTLEKDIHDRELEVTGAIFFHNITQGKLTGIVRSTLDVFASMCGNKFSDSRAAFLTTQWDAIKESALDKYNTYNIDIGDKLEALYPEWPPVFVRERDEAASCKEVLRHFSALARSEVSPFPFALLTEWQSAKGDIRETSAGKTLLGRPDSAGVQV